MAKQGTMPRAVWQITRHAAALIPAMLVLSSLTACGGGGGGGGSLPTAILQSINTVNAANTAQPAPANDPQPGGAAGPARSAPGFDVNAHDFATEGTPSTPAAALSALEETYLPLYLMAFGRWFGPLTQQRFDYETGLQDSFQAATDTRAHEAWAQGWTGKGVKVGHLDDFTTVDTIPPFTHGQLVRYITQQVAPEIDRAERQLTFGCTVPGQQQRDAMEAGYDYFNANGYHIVNNSFGWARYDDGRCSGNPRLLPDSDWRAAIDETARDNIFLQVAQPIGTAGGYDANMLFVYAAGNEKPHCRGGLAACNLYAAAIDRLRGNGDRNAGERVVFVGALADASDSIADYSITAGEEMKYDYVVAHDDVDSLGDYSGTSFAAPRVAGAAALVRHKFPNLNGAALKQVLLQTADDLGQSGVDIVFGHGKLNILNALSPVGRVTSR